MYTIPLFDNDDAFIISRARLDVQIVFTFSFLLVREWTRLRGVDRACARIFNLGVG